MKALKAMIKRVLARNPGLFRVARLWQRWYVARYKYPRWRGVVGTGGLSANAESANAHQSPRVLIGTTMGGFLGPVTLESVIAVALTLRKAHVEVVLCDGFLPACMECEIRWYPRLDKFVRSGPQADLCKDCCRSARSLFENELGMKVHSYAATVTADEKARARDIAKMTPADRINTWRLGNLKIGEHAVAGALRFFAKGDISDEPRGEEVLRMYFEAALLSAFSIQRLLREQHYDVAVFHHGIYIPQGIIGEVCRENGVRVVNWNPAYRKKCFIFSHKDTYHHTLMDEPVDRWEHLPWDDRLDAQLMSYLKSRWEGTEDWIWFHEKPVFDWKKVAPDLGLDTTKPIVGLLTNVVWDAQLHYPANAFPGMIDWIVETIRYFSGRTDIQLLIRVHPAEIRGTLPSRQRVVEEIEKVFPVLPANIFVIPPESDVSTYVAMHGCDSVIIYGTKTGVELTSVGIPVVVAGEAWIRNKGITRDAANRDDYVRILEELPFGRNMSPEQVLRARKYAYHFFFRRMIPIDFMQPAKSGAPYRIQLRHVDELRPGRSKGLDVICDGILRGSDFIFPAETIGAES